MVRLADRTTRIAPFYAVETLKQAQALAARGHDIISLGIGEPDFTAPTRVLETLKRAADAGLSGYTAPAGLPALREAIAHDYHARFDAHVDPGRILVTTGASGALLLAVSALVNPGDEILMPDPCYPANRNFVTAAGGQARLVPTTAANGFQLSVEDVVQSWGPRTRGVLIASPGNPTGTSMPRDTLKAVIAAVRARGGFVIMDEIYLGLSYDTTPRSALSLDDDLIVINSFSKYFHMTGWRLGWLVAPAAMVPALERLAASLAICAPTLAQHAALSCFEPEVMTIYEHRRLSFKERRDVLLPAFERIGLDVPARPDGAFYIYASVQRFGLDSLDFCQRLLHEAHIAAVPGLDFGSAHAQDMVRFSYATGLNRLREAVTRLERFLPALAAARRDTAS